MSALLLATAAGLGLLAFFEPCTIATHTLFAARSSRDAAHRRRAALAQLVLSRSALLAGLFGTAAAIGLDGLSASQAALMLGTIGTVYLVTRRVYLPVPHLEFFRLIPRGRRLPQALRLGLTLPACTLPLVAVVGVIAALSQRIDLALGAGLAFAGMFAYIAGSPFVLIQLHGIPAEHFGWVFGLNALGFVVASQVNARLLKTRGITWLLHHAIWLPALAGAVLAEKMEHVSKTAAAVVVSANPGCHLQLCQGVRRSGLEGQVRVLSLAEFLDERWG